MKARACRAMKVKSKSAMAARKIARRACARAWRRKQQWHQRAKAVVKISESGVIAKWRIGKCHQQ